MLISKLLSLLDKKLINPDFKDEFLHRCLYIAFCVVSTVMTIANVFTSFVALRNTTAIFAAISLLCFILTFLGPRFKKIIAIFFSLCMMAMFTFFIINGSPEGFSAFWAPMLPACGILMFGVKFGLILDTIMLLDIIFLCWIPFGQSLILFEYTQSFLLRFPLLFAGYMTVGIIIGIVLERTQKLVYNQSIHDSLTGAYNRLGFLNTIHSLLQEDEYPIVGFIILDLDHFKRVNDTFGHFVGDEVLRHSCDIINECVGDNPVCRWGGEEFAIFITNGDETEEICARIVKTFDEDDCVTEDGDIIHQTVSVGAITDYSSVKTNINMAYLDADKCLYKAKNSGRNKYIFNAEE